MNWKRPLAIMPLLGVGLTLIILTAMLAKMVANRISLLENGTEIVLKTAPIDPRDLLRGYFVRLQFDISRITLDDLERPLSNQDRAAGFKRHSPVFITLRPDQEGYWSPVSLHHAHPANDTRQDDDPTAVVIRGSVLYDACRNKKIINDNCKVSIRYGIEKFFTEKARAKKLEDFGRQRTPELKELTKRIKELQKKYSLAFTRVRERARGAENRLELIRNARNKPEIKIISKQLNKLRAKRSKLRAQNRKEMAKRFAIIVRVDKQSGEAAISGLQLDGKRIYEERLL